MLNITESPREILDEIMDDYESPGAGIKEIVGDFDGTEILEFAKREAKDYPFVFDMSSFLGGVCFGMTIINKINGNDSGD
jgi:hypothetical protein